MLTLERHDDVTRVVMSTRISRSIGYGVSAFLVRGVLIDLGFPAVARELAAFLDRARPSGVLLTHYHEDHAGNVELAARGRLPIGASEATRAALAAHPPLGLYRRVIWGTPPRLTSPMAPFDTDALRLLPTPGHSADHHVVWDAERETLFAGDLFLGVKVRVAHPGEDPRALARSVRAAAELRPARLFDAHRGLVPNPVDALLAKADWLEETIAAIERGIAAGRDDRTIAREVLGAEELAHYVSRGGLSRVNF
ncbi:MAG TPA: MBL fold metallo-hydrolase, partial [Gemmatimonadaceae bacterium]|nr:MBL fold metallo-hydrolase [Gemmatimonadaceae bacterium]